MSRFTGVVWRHVPAGKEPLHVGAIWRYSQGRWNQRGDYAALYTALTMEGARTEWRRLADSAGSAMGPRDLVSLTVKVEPVLDLTRPAIYQRTARSAGVTVHPRFHSHLTDVPHDHCHALAAQARSERYTALLVPSAARDGGTNLVIYFDIVAPRLVELDNGPDRIPLG